VKTKSVAAVAAAVVLAGLMSAAPADAGTPAYPANVDYASGSYGKYAPAALTDSWVGGVDINMDWDQVQPTMKKYDWTPLDKELQAWSLAGKHVIIVVRFANEVGGGCSADSGSFLPGWEIARIPTFCDTDLNSLIPDYFSSRFQSDFLTFIAKLGSHLAASPYKSAISYIRIGVGLGGEGFYLMPDGTYGTEHQTQLSAYKAKLEAWGYTAQAWEAWQEKMLAAYVAARPAGIQVIYPIVVQDINAKTSEPVDLDVAKWATDHGGIGIGQECIRPAGYGSGGGYADFNQIDSWVHAHHPKAYIQFQTCGVVPSSQVPGIISAAKRYWGRSVEWYESTITDSAYESEMNGYQTGVNHAFG
jgi:hypothetical protein